MSKVLFHTALICTLISPLMITQASAEITPSDQQLSNGGTSALRKPNESYQQARDRVLGKSAQLNHGLLVQQSPSPNRRTSRHNA